MRAAPPVPPRRFLFVLWEGGGNVPPQLGLARRLVARGHAVRVLSDPCNAAEAAAAGCAFVPYARAPHRRDKSAASTLVPDWEARGPAQAFALLRDRLMFGPARAYAEDVLAELARAPADALVVNDVLYGAQAAAERAGVPLAVLVPNCYLGPARGLPLLGLPPAGGPLGRLRDAVVAGLVRREVAKGLPALNAARAALGLPPVGHPWEQLLRAARVLVLTSRAFDFPAAWLPPNVRYVGPQLDDPAWAAPWEPPWPWGPGPGRAPLVLVSFSTTFQNQGALLQRVLDALGGLPVRGPSSGPWHTACRWSSSRWAATSPTTPRGWRRGGAGCACPRGPPSRRSGRRSGAWWRSRASGSGPAAWPARSATTRGGRPRWWSWNSSRRGPEGRRAAARRSPARACRSPADPPLIPRCRKTIGGGPSCRSPLGTRASARPSSRTARRPANRRLRVALRG
jgi:UDP:flavonoid glycosyltransferase YjiC (YdhE family)